MKTYVQNSEANWGQTLRASLGLLIFTLVGCGAAIVLSLRAWGRCYLIIKRMVV